MRIEKTDEFDRWIRGLRDLAGRLRILQRIDRLAHGNPGRVEPVGSGVSEMKINVGPGYRVYFIERSKGRIVVLLCGGDKDSQVRDVARAKALAANL
ncbi:type II toxin-antitoxin system RelE/ParE family toxin [Methylobacterium sp. WL69]|uniref:type II toxin-antitoxin system RelE/ParE family toxin n=1 Tax=Methylobacterium sp. WL69 TaxID=2603893 RepID=UPI0011C85244|nr:type II toxin-antitoxin system RelE/ParE family toxin [Methylobacterium sp. WL69]TXM74351.1 type II toxin-antitoxin system RelE/ParE family toxin [Methylobacterium sp. WL69]